MDAVKFAREYGRVCGKYKHKGCLDCPIGMMNGGYCQKTIGEMPEKAVSTIEKWSKKHPRRTYLSVLLEKFPNTKLVTNGNPAFCPNELFGGTRWEKCVVHNCFDCWNREYKEEK